MTTRSTIIFWLGMIVLFLGLVWLFNAVLMPFILGIAIAYFLNPLVVRLVEKQFPRWLAVLVILFGFLGLAGLGLVLLLPVLGREMADLYRETPTLIASAQGFARDVLLRFGIELDADPAGMVDTMQSNASSIFNIGRNLVSYIMAGGAAVISFFTFIFLMPIVAFYMMVDWPNLVAKFDELLPRGQSEKIRGIMADIDRTLAGFVRGQLTVCSILGIFYGVALTLVGLKFGFVIGITAGILSIIPFFGAILGLILSVGVAWFTSGDMTLVVLSLIIFAIGQFAEGNFLTPKLVGENIGLHPLWIIFALMAGGALLGFTGMLVAVPVAAVVGVMVRFALSEYKQSQYYGS